MTLNHQRPQRPPRKGRLRSGESHDGCTTCKIRKVKCDEQRPACQRCLGTGRKCDGYAHDDILQIGQRSTDVAGPLFDVPTTYAHAELTEPPSFKLFILRVVPGFIRVVDQHFWHQIIPRLGRSDPVIWDTVNALACLVQYPRYSSVFVLPESKKALVSDRNHRKALKWYSKSMAGLRERMRQGITGSHTTTVTCILYICIECLQGNIVEAVVLYYRAVAMIVLREEGEPLG